MQRRTFLTALPLAMAVRRAAAQSPAPHRSYGATMLDTLGLPENFPAFGFVNPDAPKGGEVALAEVGNFDSFNGFIVRGTAASGLGRVYDTLLRPDPDETSTAYCHLATFVEISADRRTIAFELRPEAKFNDGRQITAADVVWTFEALRSKGRPFYRAYYADVTEAVAESAARVVFRMKDNENREMPLILGEMAVLPKHWWDGRDFSAPLTDPPLGSGPYKVDSVDFGRSVTYRRIPTYWAANLPTARGLNNFDVIRTEYYRDATVALEAFKAGHADYRTENISKQWATAYDFPALQKGLVKKENIAQHMPTGMQGFAVNTRRDQFKDARVREALAMAFDFEWCNANLFYGAYTRTNSYFSNSELASSGLPSEAELALLTPLKDQIPPQVFTTEFKLPVTDGSGNNRANLMRALQLLKEAGWEVKERKLVSAQGTQMSLEILLDEPAFERLALPYVQWLGRLGIDARVRTVDPAQYQRLMDAFDYDMTVTVFSESESPGNEQTGYWSSATAKQEGSDNIIGVSNPAIDRLVTTLVQAPTREQLVTAARALDRVLLWSWFVVPHYYLQSVRVAYWDRFGRPSKPVRTGVDFDSWWVDRELAAKTDAARQAGMQ